MASINGITLKAVKMFRGHEGEPCYQGNVYIGGKKIGFWSNDSWGGCDNFMFDKPYSERKLAARVSELHPECIKTHTRPDGSTYTTDYSLEILFADLLVLQEDEKDFKKAIKDGFSGIMIETDGYHQINWSLNEKIMMLSNEEILDKFKKSLEDSKKKAGFFEENEWTKHVVKIYRNLNDFNVGTPITLDDIKEG